MADFYQDMQDTAAELLTEFNQGVIHFIPVVQGPNDWDGVTEGLPVKIEATVKGASAQYWSDLITQSDLEVTAAVFDQVPAINGLVSIDGDKKQIIQIDPIPAAGTTVAWRIFVKG